MAIEYLTTKQVMALFEGMKARQARELMHEVGMVKIGHGVIRRDALDRYLAYKTERTFYTAPLLDPPRSKAERYARTRKEA